MKTLLLGNSLKALIDHRGKTPKKLGADFTSSGVPVASALLVSNGVLDLSRARYVSHDVYRRWMPVSTRQGDVLLTSEAPVGRVARVPSDDPLVLGQRLFGLRGKPGVLDNGFLYYALQTQGVLADLIGRSTGTTVIGIRQSALRDVQIAAPPYDQQQGIGQVLSSLDEKIAIDRSIVATGRELCVRLVSETREAVQLATVVSPSRQTLVPAELGDTVVAHFSLPAFDSGERAEHVPASSILSTKQVLDRSCVLVSKLNPRFPRVWDIIEVGDTTSLASTEFLVLESLHCSSSVLWAVLSQASFWDSLRLKAAGTSGSHQRVRPSDLLATEVVDPRAIDPRVQQLVTEIGRRKAAARAESATLAELRDTLLPELMSGRLRVKDAEKAVEGVL